MLAAAGRILTKSFSTKMAEKSLIAVCQMTTNHDLNANFETCRDMIERAGERRCKMIFFPECFDYIGRTKEENISLAMDEDCEYIGQFRDLARKHKIWLSLGGLHRYDKSGYPWNTHLIIDDEGITRAKYNKLHLFDLDIPGKVRLMESEFSRAGEKMVLPVESPIGKIGLSICYDLRFPELSIWNRKKQADVLTYPAAFTLTTGLAHWEVLLRARAIESQCYVVAAAQTGKHNEKRMSYGHAMIVDPWGAVIAQCSERVDMAFAEIDLGYVAELRQMQPVFSHRRDDLYSLHVNEIDPDNTPLKFGQFEISADSIFYRSKFSFGFVNLKPVLPGHVLISTKTPHKRLIDLSDEETADLFATAKTVQKMLEKYHSVTSSTVCVQDGRDAGQTVEHVHVHILPRRAGDFGASPDDLYKNLEEHDNQNSMANVRTKLSEWRGVPSASRVFANSGYEISDDLQRLKTEVLEKRYGGRVTSHRAAAVIQRAFRQYRLRNCWKQKTTIPFNRPPFFARSNVMPNGHCQSPSAANSSPSLRYTATSLSAQLKAQAKQDQDRTFPSSMANSSTRMIDSLMSPRLSQRRTGQDHNSVPVVWVPRASLANQNAAHSNSLPRLERHAVRECTPNKASRPVLTEQDRKRQYRIALNFFNKKPERGIFLLTHYGFVSNSPDAIAKILFGRRGLSKQQVGEYIGTLHSSFHSCVLKYFMNLIEIRGLELDCALRIAFQFFILPKETEKIDRVLQAFSVHYCKYNPKRIESFRGGVDSVHLLAFAIIMLNTDLHSPSLKNFARMKREDFIRNLRGQDKLSTEKDGRDFNRQLLEGIYERVKADEFLPGDDHVAQVMRVDNAIVGKDKPLLTETQRRLVCYCRLQQIDDPTKKQAKTRHERDVFLFNDMLVIAKSSDRRSSSNSNTSYIMKSHTPLLGARVEEFKSICYDYGLTITTTSKEKFHFNARNAEDRRRFVADVAESIKESIQMEDVRLELEMDKLRMESQRDSGLPDMESQSSTRRLSFNSLDSGVEDHFDHSN